MWAATGSVDDAWAPAAVAECRRLRAPRALLVTSCYASTVRRAWSVAAITRGDRCPLSLSLARALALSASGVLLLSGGFARVDFPVADTFFDTDHDFSSDSCTVDTNPVCKENLAGDRLDCLTEMADDDVQLAAIAYVISNETDASATDICDGYEYCAFGALKTGAATEATFFCGFDGGDIEDIGLWGTDGDDTLWFHHYQNGEFDLQDHAAVAAVEGALIGKDGGDNLHGSRYAGSAYTEVVRGDAGDDTIDSHAGVDEVHAGPGDDTIFTGSGKDTVCLDSGNNEVSTEDDDDTVHGGPGTDKVHLGDGDDIAWLGAGEDVACGGGDDDEVHGGSSPDQLWGNGGDYDELYGDGPSTGTPADACGSEGTYGSKVGCEGLLYSAPADCPPEHAP